jgi:hypothetical protein
MDDTDHRIAEPFPAVMAWGSAKGAGPVGTGASISVSPGMVKSHVHAFVRG